MAEALLHADRVVVMEKGRIAADATPAALMAGEGGAAAQAGWRCRAIRRAGWR
ncbi:hypothetical protein AB5I41_23030 [Sphingomonas sp. MMS24-JH45]